MNAVPAFGHDGVDFLEPYQAAIVTLERAPSRKSAIVDCEDESFKQRAISLVEWDVEEHSIAVTWRSQYALWLTTRLARCLERLGSRHTLARELPGFLRRRLG